MSNSLTDKLNAILDIKEAIKDAIEAKGVTVDGDFADYPDYIAQIETGGGDEPAAVTITSCDLGDGQQQAAFEAGQRSTLAVYFYGTGLTRDLDYSTLIQVSAPNQSWDVTYGSFGYIIEEDQEMGTPAGVAINYNITAPNTSSQNVGYITFTCDEFTGTINVCSYKITGYDYVVDSSDSINYYPNNMTVQACVYFDNAGSMSNFYLNDAAKEYISSSILSVSSHNAEFSASNMTTTVGEDDPVEGTGRGELSIEYSITPEDDGNVELTMNWGEIGPAGWTLAEAGGGDEPAAMTITSCYVGDNMDELAFEAGAEETITVHFAGTGLTEDLDYASLIQVETHDTEETWTITYDSVNSADEDGTWVDINYNVVVPDWQSRYAETMTFTCDEFEGVIGICSYKISGYEFTDNTSEYNDYPNSMNAVVNVYFDNSGSVTDFNLNDAAKDNIANGMLEVTTGNAEWDINNMITSIDMVDEWTGRGVLQITYTITPSDANEVELTMNWGEIGEESWTFAVPSQE